MNLKMHFLTNFKLINQRQRIDLMRSIAILWQFSCNHLIFESLLISSQRSYQRWLDNRIYKTEMKFWAVLGSQAAEKKIPNCHMYAPLWGGFLCFQGQKIFFFWKYPSVPTRNLHDVKLNKISKIYKKIIIK